MSLRKRLKVLWYSLTQEWSEETCSTCGATWFTDARCVPSEPDCASCEGKAFEAWLVRDRVRREMQEQSKGAA